MIKELLKEFRRARAHYYAKKSFKYAWKYAEAYGGPNFSNGPAKDSKQTVHFSHGWSMIILPNAEAKRIVDETIDKWVKG